MEEVCSKERRDERDSGRAPRSRLRQRRAGSGDKFLGLESVAGQEQVGNRNDSGWRDRRAGSGEGERGAERDSERSEMARSSPCAGSERTVMRADLLLGLPGE